MTDKLLRRSDIDLLRAVAVLLVIFYHYFPSVIEFGYLGVDIFLVISGYLMVASYKNSKNISHIYVKKMSTSHVYMANLDYDRSTALFWNKNHELPDQGKYRNRFAYTKFSFSAISKELAADKLKYYSTFFVSDLNEFSENQIYLNTNLSKTVNGLPFLLEIELNDYLNYNNPDSKFESTNVQSFHFSPSTSLTKYGFEFDLGLEFHYLSDGTPFDIFPQVKATKELVKDVLLVFGGLRHSEQRHTLKSLSDENPYIHSYGANQTILSGNAILLNLKRTDTDELYVTMRNVLAKDEVFEGSVAYGTVKNFAHFVGGVDLNYNRFLVDYVDVKQFHVNMNYYRKINEIIDLNANANYYNWDMEVYHKPNFTCDVSIPINLRDKIKVNPSLVIIDDFDLVFKPEKTIAFLSFLKPAKTVILSDKIQRDKVELLERVGVCQFFSSFITQPQINDLLDAVSLGKIFYDERIKTVLNYNAAEEFKNTCSQLNISEREVEIIKLIAEGFINKEIADQLFLSTHTVNTHRKNIMSKLGVNNATGIVIFAVRERLISPNDFLFSSKH